MYLGESHPCWAGRHCGTNQHHPMVEKKQKETPNPRSSALCPRLAAKLPAASPGPSLVQGSHGVSRTALPFPFPLQAL